jgi:hypothetical protein
MSKQYFRVASSWMQSCGMGDEAHVFPVVRTESNKDGQPEYDILVLERHGFGEWPVFRIRGRSIPPFTIVLREGEFYPATADCLEPPGTIKVAAAEYHTLHEAVEACEDINNALNITRKAALTALQDA